MPIVTILAALVSPLAALPSPGAGVSELHVASVLRIGAGEGGFGGDTVGDVFGSALAPLGDVDGDGIDDLAVGAFWDDDTGVRRGAVWILFLEPGGTVKAEQKINTIEGGFSGPLSFDARFGGALAGLGDLDGDGVPDLAAAAPMFTGDETYEGALWILFLNADGTVKAQQMIGDGIGGGPATPNLLTQFGKALSPLGDLDGDGTPDLAVGSDEGLVWILFLEPDGTVGTLRQHSGPPDFGASLANLGDLDGDGVVELAVGLPGLGSGLRGGARILFLAADGSVRDSVDVGPGAGGLPQCASLDPDDLQLGWSAAGPGDLNGDGAPDLVLGSPFHGPQGREVSGSVWLAYLDAAGAITGFTELDASNDGLALFLEAYVASGAAVAPMGDLDGNGWVDLALGAIQDNDLSGDGAVYLYRLAPGPAPALSPIGATYCSPAVPNSTGSPGRLLVAGSEVLAESRLYLRAQDLPPGSNVGYFLMGTGDDVFTPPTAAGPICVTPGLRRLLPSASNTTWRCGGFDRFLDTQGALFTPVTPGSTWNFQAWHRDGAGLSNFTDAVSVDFR